MKETVMKITEGRRNASVGPGRVLPRRRIRVRMHAGTQARTRSHACQANLRTIDSAIMQYRVEFDSVPADLGTLITTGFLKRAPNDPHAGYANYTADNGQARSGGDIESGDDHQTY